MIRIEEAEISSPSPSKIYMPSYGLWEMFEGDFVNMCANKTVLV